ncbi:asparagine synthase [Microbacterium sp. NPDC055683]
MGRNADAIAEGLAIAHAAARLAVKNRILVSTISLDEAFDASHFLPVAREAVASLADESEQAALDISKARKAAWGRHSQPHGTHDYRDRDVRNLRRRAKQYVGVAKALRAELEDESRLLAIVEQSREAAWGDISSTLDTRLRVEAMRPDEDPDYASMREARMQALRLVDLQKLAVETKERRSEIDG